MTLIVGLRGIDGLVLAADSRGTIGDPRYDDWFQKLVGRMVRAIPRPPSSRTEATVVA